MSQVERRMYRRRQKRARKRRLLILLLLAALAAALVIWRGRGGDFTAQRMAEPTPTPLTDDYDKTVQTRVITLPERAWYAIQTGVFSAREAADEKAGAYQDRGAPGIVVQDGEKWRVFIACYDSSEDASAVRQRLGEMQRVETYLYTWICPELRLRLTGKAGQLDVVEAGLTLLMQTAEQLRDTATLVDAGQLTTQEALNAVYDLDSQIKLWRETAQSRFGRQQPELVAQLMAVCDSWTSRRTAIESAASSPTDVSAALKLQGMSMYEEMIRLRNAIGTK